MTGIGGIGGLGGAGGANPLSGLGGSAGGGGGALSGFGDTDMGLDTGGGTQGGNFFGVAPKDSATETQGAAFGDTLRAMVIENPSASKAQASDMAARFAAGDTTIDPHQVSIASAKAGVEIQMATRTISSAVSAVRTLFQMQI
jgi:flagellar hook-basal body complex protein FliE